MGAEKNSGIAALLSSTPGAIGYVDLADAASARLTRARIRNADGRFVEAKLPGATAALEGTEVADDLTFSPLDADGPAAYPITAPTWVIVEERQPDEATRRALVDFLRSLLTDVQSVAPSLGYAALPETLRDRALAQLDRITV
jgi:phosphate transport system substrate-binding protein